MGKPTGFIEYLRELPADRPPAGRIADWKEFHLHLPEAGLRKQGARCMDCGTPFCHTGSSSAAWPAAAPSTTSSRNGTTSSIAGSGRKRSNGCTRRTISPNSPVASAPRRAKARACSASMPRPSPSKASSAPSLTAAGTKAGSPPNRRSSAPAKRWPWSAPARPDSAPPRN